MFVEHNPMDWIHNKKTINRNFRFENRKRQQVNEWNSFDGLRERKII